MQAGVFFLLTGLHQHGAGAIAEQDTGGTVGVVDDPGHGVGADHQHLLVRAGSHQMGRGRQSVEKSGTGGDQVKAPNAFRPKLMLDQAGRRRKQHVGSDSADDDGVQRGGLDAPLSQGGAGGLHGQVGGSDFGVGNVTLTDAGSLQDPLVAGIHQLLQVGVGQQPRRSVAAERGDLGPSHAAPGND